MTFVDRDPVPGNLADDLVLLFSIVGDELLLDVDGSVGWWVKELEEFNQIAADFDAFLIIHIEHLETKGRFFEAMSTLECMDMEPL